ncbi:hypothetical protein DFP93_10665 [Aneurinibacillus soli]|uniref:Uncharacterized protein n=2 Tax=Aneurinibacillus soli TaxID=1500254 RepID=A0A0U4WN61_9BACL|nr:hypothetical protein [Aneurinibacillus soli]PYE61872.1 hypothetical protein DFP93_10665 [Aneurinibacillus soli]BAU29688.1 hypothetical protein CB4_03925 [Aneurinibacillus soli]
MFDPTIYENMKVALEGAVYDLDLAGAILVTARKDRVDLATMSREYRIEFQDREARGGEKPAARMTLLASASDLAGEVLELAPIERLGCLLRVSFALYVDSLAECEEIADMLVDVWGGRPEIRQSLSFVYDPEGAPIRYENTVTLDFGRKINEDNVEDLVSIVDHTVLSLRRLSGQE